MAELTTYLSHLTVGSLSGTSQSGNLDPTKTYYLRKKGGTNISMPEGGFLFGSNTPAGSNDFVLIEERANFPAISVSINKELKSSSYTNQSYAGEDVTILTGGGTLSGSLDFHLTDDDNFFELVLSKFYDVVHTGGQEVSTTDINDSLFFVLRVLLNSKDATARYLVAGITFTSLPNEWLFGESNVQSRNLTWSQASGTRSHIISLG